MTQNPPRCQALNLSDQNRCASEATSSNGLFCSFHSRQCYGLYRGYKSRNAKLDALNASPPSYLAHSKVALINNSFEDIDAEGTLNETHDYLFRKYALLDRVIRARKLHHSRFFALSMDYGHQAYLDKLQNERTTTLRALEHLERRTVEVLYKQQKWLNWVLGCQDEEERQRDNEKKQIKKEAALFKRHWKDVEARMQEKRNTENERMQGEYLNRVYEERMAMADMSDEDASEWDPIEDSVEEERGSFIDMVKQLLWLPRSTSATKSATEVTQELEVDPTPDEASLTAGKELKSHVDKNSTFVKSPEVNDNAASSKHAKKQAKKARAKAAKAKDETSKTETSLPNNEVTTPMNETKEEVRERLVRGEAHDPFAGLKKHPGGCLVAGTIENPHETMGRTPGLPSEEVNKLIEDISEIRLLLFCRLLLSHATLLPVALRANSVEQFLNDKDVSATDLRDLCLRLEQPSLQEIRDACADLARSDESGDDGGEDDSGDRVDAEHAREHRWLLNKESSMPKKWTSKQEKAIEKKRRERAREVRPQVEDPGKALDFGIIDCRTPPSKKVKIKMCGKTIWNYPSEKTMARGGWFHWAIMAKDSHLADAINLCRNWNEFWELNILALFRYFPGAHYVTWAGDMARQQFLRLGLIPYYHYTAAEQSTAYHQSGGHGQQGRFHAMAETRNFTCVHVKRDDPVSRRLIKYLTLQTWALCTLVRDGTNGRIIVQPPEEQLWLRREKFGPGRASKSEWRVLKSVGKKLFEEMDEQREWRFGFDDYYDVCIWDNEPGRPFAALYSIVTEAMVKAGRFQKGVDFYSAAAPILKTLTLDKDTHRCRDIRPGESARSIFDHISGAGSHFVFGDKLDEVEPPNGVWYDEADALEDSILFPEEASGNASDALVKFKPNRIDQWEERGPDLDRFAHDLDTDDESDDISDEDLDEWLDEDDENFDEDFEEELDDKDDDDYEYFFQDEELDDKNLSDHPARDPDPLDTTAFLLATLIREDVDDYPWPKSDPQTDFFPFVEREQSKAFKPSWHEADLEPDGQERYALSNAITEARRRYNMTQPLYAWKIFQWLGTHVRDHKYVIPDLFNATAAVDLFFPSAFLESEEGKTFKDCKIFDQRWRAENPPDRRTSLSNDKLPKGFFKPWDDIKEEVFDDNFQMPLESEKVIRRVVAILYQAGILKPSYNADPLGQGRCRKMGRALALPDPNRNGHPQDLYIDYRSATIGDAAAYLSNPDKVDLLASARSFVSDLSTADAPNARFALFRVWSATHFWPCMVGDQSRSLLTFADGQLRSWDWRFLPKDSPCSGWSIHHAVKYRILPFEQQFNGVLGRDEALPPQYLWMLDKKKAKARELGDAGRHGEKGETRVIVKKDMILVMGKDEEDLRKYATGVAYAVITKPWRLELDLWKSFVNIDLAFLEELETLGWIW